MQQLLLERFFEVPSIHHHVCIKIEVEVVARCDSAHIYLQCIVKKINKFFSHFF